MRFAVDLHFKKHPRIPVFYRKNLLALLKEALKDSPVYQRYYQNQEQNLMKPFTFSLSIPGCRKGEHGFLHTEYPWLKFFVSSSDPEWILQLYEAMIQMKAYPVFEDSLAEFSRFSLLPKKEIHEETIYLKTLSPVAVRRIIQRENGKLGVKSRTEPGERYLSLEDENYWESLSHSASLQCRDLNIQPDEIYFEPVKTLCRPVRVAMKNSQSGHGYSILASNLYFKVKAPSTVIQRIYDQGLGAHKSMGFGMLELSE